MYHAIGMEVGTKDTLLATNKILEQTLTRFGVKHTYEEYEGDHTNKVFERIEKNLLPFFSKNLSFENRTAATKH
jgi:enterochelin esterase-like enzyme